MKKGLIALSPLGVFITLYLVTSIIAGDFYKVPITVAFMMSSIYAIMISTGQPVRQRIDIYSRGAGNPQMMLMIWIFILAGAFAHSAKLMGCIDATVNLTLYLLPGNMLLAGLFLAACFISISIGTSVGTIVALTPIAAGVAAYTGTSIPLMTAVVVGGSFFGDNLSFISDTTIVATSTQGCKLSDKFRVNAYIVFPAALLVKELTEGALDGRKWYYYQCNADAPCEDEEAVEKFDSQFPPKVKAWQPSQEEFYIHSHSTITW